MNWWRRMMHYFVYGFLLGPPPRIGPDGPRLSDPEEVEEQMRKLEDLNARVRFIEMRRANIRREGPDDAERH